MKWRLLAGFCLAQAVLSAFACASGVPVWKTRTYTLAILSARQGQTATAMAMLNAERAKGPLPVPLLNDYLTLLCWQHAGDQAVALSVGQESRLWPDTLKILATAARDRKDFASAIRLYRFLAVRSPSATVSAALAMAQVEAGQGADALSVLDDAHPANEGDVRELTRARAYVLQLSGDYARALDYLQDAQTRFPGDAVLEQRYHDVLVRLGVPLMAGDQSATLPVSDQIQLYRLTGIGQKAGLTPSGLTAEVYRRGMPPVAFFNDYLLSLCRQGQLAMAVQLAQGHPVQLTLHSLRVMAQLAQRLNDRPRVAVIEQLLQQHKEGHAWQSAGARSMVADPVLADIRERATLLVDDGAYSQALVLLAQWQPRYAVDPVLNDRYLTVLQALGLVAQQQALVSLPSSSGRRPDWEVGQQQTAELGAWGLIQSGQETGLTRHALTDRALALNEQWLQAKTLNTDMRRMTVDLRLRLLQQRGDAAGVVALYQQHASEVFSAETQAAVADAWMTLRQPTRAEPLYRSAIALKPQSDSVLEWQLGLAYALLESGQYRAAQRQIDLLLVSVPRNQIDELTGLTRFNPDYQTVAYHHAKISAYQGDSAGAQRELDSLLEQAPHDGEVRQAMGELALLRGWPRQADEIFHRLQVDQAPQPDWNASLGRVDVALETYAFDRARMLLPKLQDARPDARELDERLDQLKAVTAPELVVNAGHDMGGKQGVSVQNAWDSLTRLYGAPIGAWRLFAQHQLQTADFTNVAPPQQGRFEAMGLGAQYRSLLGIGELGLFSDVDGRHQQGGFAGFDWTVNDDWTVGLRYEQNSSQLPLQARLTNVSGNLLQSQVQYRLSDDTAFSVQAGQLDSSDGNRRQTVTGEWSQRWVTGPVYQLNSQIQVSSSRGQAIEDASYFNPGADSEFSLGLMNDWLLWRAYDNSWHQRVGLTRGRYYQSGFGTQNLWGVTLEQEWQWSKRYALSYGLTRSQHPYDGEANYSNRAYLNLGWRF